MSFFKKMTKEFENLKASLVDDKDKDSKVGGESKPGASHDGQEQHRGAENTQYGQSQPAYGQPPPGQYGHQSSPHRHYEQPSPAPPTPSSHRGPQVPPGWTSQWDGNTQRWYYIEQSTGRTQWDPPAFSPPPPSGYPNSHYPPPVVSPDQHGQTRGGGEAGSFYNSYGGAMPPVSSQGGHGDRAQQYYGDIAQSEAKGERGEKKKDKGHGGMLLGAAGGLAAGAVGGAVIANALDNSDDEHHSHHYAAPPVASHNAPGYGGPAPYGDSNYYPAQPPSAYPDESHLSGSDRESLQEAREELAEAEADYASSRSSSDKEAMEEAREEYQEEVEEAYD